MRNPSSVFTHQQWDFLTEEQKMLMISGAMPTGFIIGSVEIVGCVINHPSVWAEKSMECKCPCCGKEIKRHFNEDYFFCEHCDRKCIKGLHYDAPTYNWVLANPILFSEPIPAKGKLSFWESELTEEQINNLHHAKN